MSVQPQLSRMTPEEYLAFERRATTRNEFVHGELVAMTGASRKHNLVCGNVHGLLWTQLRGSPCEVYVNDMRVKVAHAGDYLYPDVVVVCGEPRFEDDVFDTLLNPTLIVEVLSPSTKDYDRGGKWEKYRQIDSLRDYLVVSQDRVYVERYTRQGERFWLLSEASDVGDTVRLDSIDCTLKLADVYAQVFDERESDRPSDSPR